MGSRYVGYYTKSTNNKSKNRQVGLHQTGKLCTAKEIINRVKRQPTEQEKIFANHISDKGLVYKIHRCCYKAIAKNLIFSWGKDLKRHFYTEDIQVVNTNNHHGNANQDHSTISHHTS